MERRAWFVDWLYEVCTGLEESLDFGHKWGRAVAGCFLKPPYACWQGANFIRLEIASCANLIGVRVVVGFVGPCAICTVL